MKFCGNILGQQADLANDLKKKKNFYGQLRFIDSRTSATTPLKRSIDRRGHKTFLFTFSFRSYLQCTLKSFLIIS